MCRRIDLRPLTAVLTALLLTAPFAAPRTARAEQEDAAPAAPAPEQAPAVTLEEREAALLHSAFQYLKLTRSQISVMLWMARQTDRRRLAYEQDEQRMQKALEAQGEQNPDEAARLKKLLEESRSRAVAEITSFAAPQLARIFTREQIALAWRLNQGSPPAYANADAALLNPEGGFVEPVRPFVYSGALSDTFQLREDASLPALRRTLAPAESGERPLLGDIDMLGLDRYDVTLNRSLRLQGGRSSFGPDARPFAQWVVETSDQAALASVMEPLARRFYTSDGMVSALQEIATHGLGVSTARPSAPVGSGRKLRDYRMEHGFRDLTGQGPELEALGGQLQTGAYVFEAGQGVRLTDAGVTDHYAVDLVCRYFGGDRYQKILDFKNGTKDDGLYFYQGHLTFYMLADGGAPQPEQDFRLRLERNRATRIVRAYLNSQLIFSFIDLDGAAEFEKGAGVLFVDDQATRGEQGPGALSSLMVWSAPTNR